MTTRQRFFIRFRFAAIFREVRTCFATYGTQAITAVQIIAMKAMKIPASLAETHYAPHKGKPFYEGLVKFMSMIDSFPSGATSMTEWMRLTLSSSRQRWAEASRPILMMSRS